MSFFGDLFSRFFHKQPPVVALPVQPPVVPVAVPPEASVSIPVAPPQAPVVAPAIAVVAVQVNPLPNNPTVLHLNPDDVGKKVQAYFLDQVDNWNNPVSKGKEPQIGLNGCSFITNYICANGNIPDTPDGYNIAYNLCKDVPILSVQGFVIGTIGTGQVGAAIVPGTGKFSIAQMQKDDWAYLIKTLIIRGANLGAFIPTLFSEDSSVVGHAWFSWDNDNGAYRSMYDLNSYTGFLLGTF